MYQNPKHLRDNEIKARFNDDTYRLIKAIAAYKRTQPAVLLRDLAEEGIERILASLGDSEQLKAG